MHPISDSATTEFVSGTGKIYNSVASRQGCCTQAQDEAGAPPYGLPPSDHSARNDHAARGIFIPAVGARQCSELFALEAELVDPSPQRGGVHVLIRCVDIRRVLRAKGMRTPPTIATRRRISAVDPSAREVALAFMLRRAAGTRRRPTPRGPLIEYQAPFRRYRR
jgi:hypothetical protein